MVSAEIDLLKLINDKLGILEVVSKDRKKLKVRKAATMVKETNKLKGRVNLSEPNDK
jgi:hypothetical protein